MESRASTLAPFSNSSLTISSKFSDMATCRGVRFALVGKIGRFFFYQDSIRAAILSVRFVDICSCLDDDLDSLGLVVVQCEEQCCFVFLGENFVNLGLANALEAECQVVQIVIVDLVKDGFQGT